MGGHARPTDEAVSVTWLDPEEVPFIRAHDGTHLLSER
ncbi:hypothetical protein BQ8420_26910 [Nocardiopsis sp. JB363]|nr:hypothetical protein BQ8420_26910 [Nocardiopsis sp. JB363]